MTDHLEIIDVITPGDAAGVALKLDEPFSFWGGYDPENGRITATDHPDVGTTVTGSILALRFGRGSTSSPGPLLESLRLQTGPAGFLLCTPCPVIFTATRLSAALYGTECPVLQISEEVFDRLDRGRLVIAASTDDVRLTTG